MTSSTPDSRNPLTRLRVLLRPARNIDREALKAAYRRVFSGPAGQRVLEDICAGFKHNPVPGERLDMRDARAFQDGKEEVMRHILRMLDDES